MRLRHIGSLLKILVGAALIYLVLRQAAVDEVLAVLRSINLPIFLLAIACFIAAAALNAVRWRNVLDILGAGIPLRSAVTGTFEGMFFNLFLPTGVGGDVARAYRAYDTGVTGRTVIEGALIDRALGLWGLAIAVLVATFFSSSLYAVPGWPVLIVLVALIAICGLVVAWGADLLALRPKQGWLDSLVRLVQNYAAVVKSRRFWTEIVPVLLISNLAVCLSAWLTALSVGLLHPLPDMAIVIEGGSLAGLVPVSIGGWGVREGVIAYLLLAMETPDASAVAVSALIGITIAIVGILGAVIWIVSPYKRGFAFSKDGHGKSAPDTIRNNQPVK